MLQHEAALARIERQSGTERCAKANCGAMVGTRKQVTLLQIYK